MTTMNVLPNIKRMTIQQAARRLEKATDKGDSVMLWGSPGIGKTDIMYQLGARKKRKVIVFMLNIREPVDMRGIPVTDPLTKTTLWYYPSELPNVERDGEFGYLFLDEINASSPQMMAVAMQLVLEGKIGDYVLPKGWVVVAAGNLISDKAFAQRMPTALRNRFAHFHIVPDYAAWRVWAVANNVAPELIAFLHLRQDFLHMMPKGDENAFPTPRSLVKAAKYVDEDKEDRLAMLSSHIGDAVAAEFDGFIDLYNTFGGLDQIIANPKTAQLPNESSIRYAVCVGLARLATRKTLPAIIEYAERLPRESQILVVTDATTRDESLKNTQAYGIWSVKNQDIILQ